MNDVFENIYSRRSVRNYKSTDVPDDIIRELIKAGTYAPTAMNRQPWRFVVIKNKEMIARLSERAKKLWLDGLDKVDESFDPQVKRLANVMQRPEFNVFYGAPVLILIFAGASSHQGTFAEVENMFITDDCAAAAENMMLAARSLGIGSCWIGFGMPLDSDQEIRQELNVPDGYRLMAPLIFGYPVKDIEMAPPREADVILNWIA
ncbi:MAG TPA: nitroreductase [Candidatus Bathyarchaeia archaeon]|nr:nitroreductase [Candidatus Bathyarchaeia archaeon]